MKNRFFIILFVLLIMLVSCAVCKNSSDKAEVILEGNATTGYMWTAIPDNSGVYEITEETYTPYKSDPGMTGTGGQYKAVLRAVKEGTGFVKFVYKRSWENSPIKEEVYKVSVDEKCSITLKAEK